MGRYTGIHCPVCDKSFSEQDNIAVCPICGTPHHRECYYHNGGCIHVDWHAEGRSFSQEQEEKKQREQYKYDGMAHAKCPRCNTLNPLNGLFCQICGAPLSDKLGGNRTGSNPQDPGTPPPPNYREIPPNPYTTPFGGLDPEEELDGVPVKEIALYIRENSFRFLPEFKTYAAGIRKVGWNWASLIFGGFYFLYRKMYGIGILLILIIALLSIPNYIIVIAALEETTGQVILGISSKVLNNLFIVNNICSIILFAFRVAVSMKTNKIYYNKCIRDCKQIRAQYQEELPRYDAIAKKGSVNRKLILGLAIAYGALTFIATFLLMLSSVMV